jgi:hypothetical protein
MESRSLNDAGGTPGGLGHFLIGFAMACVGGYLLSNQVAVVGSYWSFYGTNTFGITLLPMLIGVGILFWSDRNIVGWLLAIAGALFYPGGRNCQHAHLFSGNELVQHSRDVNPFCGRARVDGASDPALSTKD